jgi:hypothetical protein
VWKNGPSRLPRNEPLSFASGPVLGFGVQALVLSNLILVRNFWSGSCVEYCWAGLLIANDETRCGGFVGGYGDFLLPRTGLGENRPLNTLLGENVEGILLT